MRIKDIVKLYSVDVLTIKQYEEFMKNVIKTNSLVEQWERRGK